jgi:hypothetical protein
MFIKSIFQIIQAFCGVFGLFLLGGFRIFLKKHVKMGRGGGLGWLSLSSNFWSLSPLLAF